MSTEVILLIVIAGVLVVDFILNSRKKSSIDETIDRIEGARPVKSKNFLDYIIKRKRNIVSFIISVHVLKILTHFFLYPRTYTREQSRVARIGHPEGDYPFSWYIESTYSDDSELIFISSFIILAILVWLFNDKIKAR